jgi:hypothetical protein
MDSDRRRYVMPNRMPEDEEKKYQRLWWRMLTKLSVRGNVCKGISFPYLRNKLVLAQTSSNKLETWTALEVFVELLGDRYPTKYKRRPKKEIVEDPLTQVLSSKENRGKLIDGFDELLKNKATQEGVLRVLQLLLDVGDEFVRKEVTQAEKEAAVTIEQLNSMAITSGVQFDKQGNATRIEQP